MDMALQYDFTNLVIGRWGPNHRPTLSLSTQCPTIHVFNYFHQLLPLFVGFLPNTLLFCCVPNVEKLLLLNPN